MQGLARGCRSIEVRKGDRWANAQRRCVNSTQVDDWELPTTNDRVEGGSGIDGNTSPTGSNVPLYLRSSQ